MTHPAHTPLPETLTVRRLAADEFGRLREALSRCRTDEPEPNPAQTVVIAAEDAGQVVGVVAAERTWVVSPLFVERGYRGLGVAEALAREIERHNAERLAEMLVTTDRHTELLVYRMGFRPLEGTLWRRRP